MANLVRQCCRVQVFLKVGWPLRFHSWTAVVIIGSVFRFVELNYWLVGCVISECVVGIRGECFCCRPWNNFIRSVVYIN